jgi:predicted unusual protein kinase regulating ubiquinone biosynthesis (AarF/ABC1/UbiB family)
VSRLTRLATAGARLGVRMVTSGKEEAALAEAAIALSSLRGLAAKVGQMASYVDGIVPDKHKEAYETSMALLRNATASSSPASIRALIATELGATVEERFAHFDEAPFASASIGQVHRATLADGRRVAVKIQHPGIADAVESDLGSARVLESLTHAVGGKRLDAGAMFDVVRARFREELDYRHEATQMDFFRHVHQGDPTISIPAVVASHSSGRVLTSEFVDGLSFDSATRAPAEQRAAWVRTMWRFVFKGILSGKRFNADPHPGNYLFHGDGKVTFLDFGCVQPISDTRRDRARALHRAAIGRDDEAFRSAALAMVGGKPGPLGDAAVAYMRRAFEPVFLSPYRITRGYAASLVDGMKDLAKMARAAPDDQFFTMDPDNVFMNRLQFGFYSVLARLDVPCDFAAVEREFLGPDS